MPSHNANLQDPQNILRILLALTLEQGGELRVKAATYDGIENSRLLLIDYDKRKNEIVLRSTTNFGRVVKIEPESYQWSQPQNVSPINRRRIEAEEEVERVTVRSDEELAEMEEKLSARQRLADMAKEGKYPTRFYTRPPNPKAATSSEPEIPSPPSGKSSTN